MTTTPPHASRLFNLEGTLLDFLGGKPHKPKSLILDIEQEPIAIQLPKELRSHVQSYLQPGDRVSCIGFSAVDYKAGIIKLKASQVFCLSRPVVARPASRVAETAAAPCTAATSGQHPVTPEQGKILVCRKSGCQKRAGQAVVTAVEQALRDHQLQDQVKIQYTGCQKRCSKAPSLTIMPGKHRYSSLKPQHVAALIEEHFCPTP
jgi:(2Fe-2S) ferredoxin